MAENQTQNNSAKDIIKNIGNLNKEIIKALINAQKIDSTDKPNKIDKDTVTTNLNTFKTLVGDTGSIKSILNSLAGISSGTYDKKGLDDAKGVVKSLGRVIDAINELKDFDASKLESNNGKSKEIAGVTIKGLNTIKNNLQAFSSENHKLEDGSVVNVPELFASFNPGSVLQNMAKGAKTAINKSYSLVKGLNDKVGEADKNFGELKVADTKNFNTVDTIVTNALAALNTVKEKFKKIEEKRTDLEYFIGKTAAGNDGTKYMQVTFDRYTPATFDDAGKLTNKAKLESITEYVQGGKSEFQQTLNNVTGALNTIKKISGLIMAYSNVFAKDKLTSTKQIEIWKLKVEKLYKVWGDVFGDDKSITGMIIGSIDMAAKFDPMIDTAFEKITKTVKKKETINGEKVTVDAEKTTTVFTERIDAAKAAIATIKGVMGLVDAYIKVFADSSGRPNTTGRINHWTKAVPPIYNRWNLVFGNGDSITGMIAKSIQDAASFNPNIPKSLVKDESLNKSPFADKADKLKKAINEIKKITGVTTAFTTIFEDKQKGLSSDANMQIINSNVKKAAGTIRNQILGSGGAMSKVLNLLTAIVVEANTWMVDDFFKDVAKKDTEGNDVIGENGKTVMLGSPFVQKINEIKLAVNSIKKLGDIFKTVDNVIVTLQTQIDSEFYKNIGWFHKHVLDAKKGPIQQALNLLDSINKFINDSARFAIVTELKAEADKEPANEKTGKRSGCPWWQTVGETVAVIKGIQILTQIPKAVDATYKKLSDMDRDIDVASLVPKIVRMTKDLVNQIGDGLDGINEVVMQSSMATVDKKTSEAMQTTNTLLKSISDLVTIVVQSGEQMENYGYRRLVHASIQIEFFIEILTQSLQDITDAAQELISNADKYKQLAKQISDAVDPIYEVYNTISELFGVVDGVKLMPQPLLKLKAKILKNRIRTGIIIINRILSELQTEIQSITPSDREKMEQFDDILEPIKNVFELIDVINKVPLPNMLLFRHRTKRLRRRVLMVAEFVAELQAEIQNIANGKVDNAKAIRKIQITVSAIKDIMDVFNTIGGIAMKLLIKSKFITPAVNLIIKQLHVFDKLIDQIGKIKDTRNANRKIHRMAEIVRSIALLATAMIILVPILAIFALVAPVLLIGILVFAIVTKTIIFVVKHTLTAETAMMILSVVAIIGSFIVMAGMLLILATLVVALKDGIKPIILFTLGVVAFMAALALLGLGVSFAAPFIGMAVLGIALVTIAVGAMLLMALCLKLLETVDLDTEAIRTNTRLILDTAIDIMMLAFGPQTDPRGKAENTSFLDVIGGTIVNIIRALASSVILVLTAISVMAILVIAVMIRLLANIDKEKLKNGAEMAGIVVQTARDIINMLFRPDDTDRTESDRGGLLCVVGYVFGKEFENIVRAMLAVAYLGVMVMAIAMISFLAMMLRGLGKINPMEIEQAKTNATLVVRTCCEIMDTIFTGDSDADTKSGGGWLKKMLKWVLPANLLEIVDAMVKIGRLALLVVAVGAIGKLADQLTKLAGFKVSSEEAKRKATQIVGAASTLVMNLKTLSGGVDADEDELSKMYTLCITLSKIPSGLKSVADNIVKLNEYSADSIETARLTGINVVSTMKQLVEGIDDIRYDANTMASKLDIIDRISKTIGSFVQVTPEDVKNSKDITENYIKFFKQVDGMDIKKLQHTDWLMRSWASISRDLKGDFEGLAKTVNQHIMPMLEKVNETLEKTTKAQQDIIDIMSQPVDLNNGPGSTPTFSQSSGTTQPSGDIGGSTFTPSTGNAGSSYGKTQPASKTQNLPKVAGGGGIDPTDMKAGKKYVVTIADKVTEY